LERKKRKGKKKRRRKEEKKEIPCFVFGENIKIQGLDGKSESSWTALPKSLPSVAEDD